MPEISVLYSLRIVFLEMGPRMIFYHEYKMDIL